MDFHDNWSIDSCQKRVFTDQCYMTVLGASSVQLIELTCFLKLSTDQLLVLIDRRLKYIKKRPYDK